MVLIGVLYAVFVGMTFVNSKLMLTNPYPYFVGMLRAFGSSLFLVSFSLIFYRKTLAGLIKKISNWKDLIIFGVLVHGVAMCGFSYAMQYANPVTFCFIYATNPFITAIIQHVLGSENLNAKKMIALFVGLCGLIPVLLASNHGDQVDIPADLELWGNAICFISVVLFAYGWIAMKRFLNDHDDYPMAVVNGIPMFIGGCVSSMLFAWSKYTTSFVLNFTPDFSMLITIFVLSSLMTYILYAHLLKTYSATFIAFAGFLEPVFGMLLGAAYTGYQITTGSIIALGVIFFGLYLFFQEEQASHKTDIIVDPEM